MPGSGVPGAEHGGSGPSTCATYAAEPGGRHQRSVAGHATRSYHSPTSRSAPRVHRVLRRYARLVSLDAMIRKPPDEIAAAEGCRARSSPEAVGAPPSSSPASNAGPLSRRLQRVAGEAPKVVRRIIFSRRSMRKKGPLLVGNAAATRWHRVRNVRGTEMRGNCSLCGDVPVRWIQSDGHFVCASPARKRQHADRERRRRRLALYGLSMDDYERMAESRAIDVPSAAGRRPAWTPMAPLLSTTTTGPGRFVGCCAPCAIRGQWDSVRSVRVVVRCRDEVGLAAVSTRRGGHAT